MPKPKPVVDAKRCNPLVCGHGICVAVAACTGHLLQQEEPGQAPIVVADCKACGKCSRECPLGAIIMI